MRQIEAPKSELPPHERFIEMLYSPKSGWKPEVVDKFAVHLRRHAKLREKMGTVAYQERRDAIAARDAEKAYVAALTDQLFDAGLYSNFHNHSFEGLEIDEGNEKALMFLNRLVNEWEPGHKGLTLEGSVGCGKTHAVIALTVLVVTKFRKQVSAKFVSERDYLGQLRNAFGRDTYDTTPSVTQVKEWTFRRPNFLVLDDLGADGLDRKDWAKDAVLELFDYRFNYRLTTVVTTNCNDQQLAKIYGERVVSRLYGRSPVVKMTGPDRRQNTIPEADDPFLDL